MLVMDSPIEHPTILNYPHVIDGLWYPGSVTKYGAGAYSWARKSLWSEVEEAGVYQTMDASAAGIDVGSEGVLFHPHLSGEYAPQWDTKLRASFTGFTLGHTRGHLTRAVLEGVAFQIRSALDQILENGGSCQEVRLIGGGAKSRLWAHIMADVLGRELIVPEQRSAAFGACLMAGEATGLFSIDFDELLTVERFHPDQKRQEIYEDLFGSYRRMDRSLEPISHKIEDLIS
jgi:xylulokinase